MKKRRKGLSQQIITVCRALKIREQQLDPCSALGGLCTLCPSRAQTHPSNLASPVGSTKCFSSSEGFPSLLCSCLASRPGCREPQQGRAWHRLPGPGGAQVLPPECQELFPGEPWLLPSGTGGKEPLT